MVFRINIMILYIAPVVLSQNTKVTDRQTTTDRQHIMRIADLCNAIAKSFQIAQKINSHRNHFIIL